MKLLLMVTLFLGSASTSLAMECSERGARILNHILSFEYSPEFTGSVRDWLKDTDYTCPFFKSAGITKEKVEQFTNFLDKPEALKILNDFGKDPKGNISEREIQEGLNHLAALGIDLNDSLIKDKVSALRIAYARHKKFYESAETCPTLPKTPITHIEIPMPPGGPGWCSDYAAAAISSNYLGYMVSPLSFALADNLDSVKRGYIFESEIMTNDKGHFDYFETVEECERYLCAAEQDFPASWMFSVIALNTGARLGEILALRWRDLDLKARRLHIYRTMDNTSGVIEERTKSSNDRWLGINDSLFEALLRFRTLTKRLNPNDLIVSGDGGESYRTRIRSAHERSCKRASLRVIRPHDLRHTYASHFVMSGGTLDDLRALLGHASVKMVLRYAHLAPGYLEKKANTVCLRSRKNADIISLDEKKKQLG